MPSPTIEAETFALPVPVEFHVTLIAFAPPTGAALAKLTALMVRGVAAPFTVM